MADAAYEAAVKETFETKPLRTVLMIDDEFPTFADLAHGEIEASRRQFAQKDRAVALYEAFQKRHMICDVENVASDVRTERLRKSDLIILDYHLGPAAGDSEKAIEILRDLCGSKHFNTVVVYTAEPDQEKVWLDIIASISGGWADYPARLAGDAQQHWDKLSDNGTLPTAALDAVMQFAQRRSVRDLSPPVRKAAQDELVALGVPAKVCKEIITSMIHIEMSRRAGAYAAAPYRRAVGNFKGGKRWIQSGNAFVTILKKVDLTRDELDPAGVMACLSDALSAWRPNLIQILISEIQNILELEALAAEDDLLRDPVTHAALWYYLLHSLGPIDPKDSPDVKVPLMSVVDKIVDGVRRRLSSDRELLSLASNVLLGELRDMNWTEETWPKPGSSDMISASAKIARTDEVRGPDTLFRLNSFFSTERFHRAHLTTGTVFHFPPTGEYFVAASPACDLVARSPGREQVWAHAIFPLTPVVAILLHTTDVNSALAEAEHALHLFFEIGADQKSFKVVNGSDQPSYEFFFAKNEGRVREEAGKILFDAARLKPKTDAPGERELEYGTFEIVDQLRRMYATRVLQMTGQHLSRIGLDFIKMPTS